MRDPDRRLAGDETVLVALRPHWNTLLAPLVLAMVFAAAAGFAYAALPAGLALTSIAIAVAGWVVVGLPRVLRRWATSYLVTTERVIVRSGVLRRAGSEIPLTRINDVQFHQALTGRLLGHGTIRIVTDGPTRVLEDVPDPEAVQAQIYTARMLRSAGRDAAGRRDTVAQLEVLADLHARGQLDDEEFRAHKQRLLDGPATRDDAY